MIITTNTQCEWLPRNVTGKTAKNQKHKVGEN